jgi:hypothetical protein
VVPERPVYFGPVQAELEASCALTACHGAGSARVLVLYPGEPRLNYELLTGAASHLLRCGEEALSSPILDKLRGPVHAGGFHRVPAMVRWLRSCALYDASGSPPAFCGAR